MAVQQETPIGDDDLDALMAQLEEETAGMVAAPPAAKAAPVVEDDPLAGLDEDPTVFAPATTAKVEAAVDLDPTDPRDSGIVDLETEAKLDRQIAAANASAAEPSLDDELAALEAEMGGTATAARKPDDKFAALAGKLKDKYPSDIPKAAKELNKAGVVSEDDAVALAQAQAAREETLDEELKAIAGTLKPAGKVAAALPDPDETPKNPNPPPVEEKPAAARSTAPAGLQHSIDVAQFRKDISVSETNLDNCMMEQAGLIAYYVEQAAKAEAQYLRLKARFGVLEAQLYDTHRKALVAAGEKATEKQVENAVKIDPKWLHNQNIVIEAETIATINKGLVESLKQRRDMIIQLGADRREEGKGAARIVAAGAAHADAKSRAMELAKAR
jgi:hypothetical protein